MSRTIILHADGSCLGNPGPGGWAAQIQVDGEQIDLSGGAAQTTNNRMELAAAIGALARIATLARKGDTVRMRLDSQYVLKGLFEWLPGWQRKGWRTSTNNPVVNDDLWKLLAARKAALEALGVTLVAAWVKGHAGDAGNERVDGMAQAMARSFR